MSKARLLFYVEKIIHEHVPEDYSKEQYDLINGWEHIKVPYEQWQAFHVMQEKESKEMNGKEIHQANKVAVTTETFDETVQRVESQDTFVQWIGSIDAMRQEINTPD